MIIMFGRKDLPPRIITGVTQVRRIGTQDGEYFGWWRKDRMYGTGYSIKWLTERYTHIIVLDGADMRKPHQPTAAPVMHPTVRRVSDVLH